MLIWTLLQDLGVVWTRRERERRLFWLCCQVQWELVQRYPDYTSVGVQEVPLALGDETREILLEILPEARRRD